MKILLAEDERLTRRSLQRELERWGHEVLAVENGVAAWDEFQRTQFDMVLTDWDMPEMDGKELIERVRAHDRAGYAYVIMLTGRSETQDVVVGMEAGADDFLAKPWEREELRVRLAAGERIIDLERRLAEQNQKLHDANEQMHRDLEAAARVQQGLLPTELPQVGKLRFAWRYRPCDELGGDLLNVVPIGDREAAMYLADVSGHGVSAALVSVSVHRSLSVRGDRSSLILHHGESPNEVTATPPDQVAARLNALYPMESNGDHFLTLVYAAVDAESLKFTYCAAGHPGPIVVRAGTETQVLESTGPPIGVVAYSRYRRNSIQLQAGDRVYLYSDGLDEAMSPARELFGQDRIQTAIDQTGAMSLDESLDALLDAAVAWQGSEGFSDDVSLLALEVPGDSGAGG